MSVYIEEIRGTRLQDKQRGMQWALEELLQALAVAGDTQ
jgi:hypothetical protein